jgi:hypothetical protein
LLLTHARRRENGRYLVGRSPALATINARAVFAEFVQFGVGVAVPVAKAPSISLQVPQKRKLSHRVSESVRIAIRVSSIDGAAAFGDRRTQGRLDYG